MIVFIIIAGILGIPAAVMLVRSGFFSKSVTSGTASPALPTKGLSTVAKQAYKEYMALPKDSRPFPEIIPALRALDAQTEVDALERRRHFDDNWLPLSRVQNGPHRFNWNAHRISCDHAERWCRFAGYYSLHVAIADVAASLKEKERAIALAANQHGVDMLKELESALRSEAGIQRQVVRELS